MKGIGVNRLKASKVAFLTAALCFMPTPAGADEVAIGASVTAPDGLTVTVNGINKEEKSGSIRLTITYRLTNNTAGQKIDEGQFKLFFADGTSEPQYGFFGSLFPTDTLTRSYTWEYLKTKQPKVIEYGAAFFSNKPASANPQWWQAPFSAADEKAAEDKAAAEKAAADKAAAEKAAADKAAADKAAAETRATVLRSCESLESALKNFRSTLQSLGQRDRTWLETLAVLQDEADSLALNCSDPKSAMSVGELELRRVALKRLELQASDISKQIDKAKKRTITCIKGKTIKKITAVTPKCPAGYKKR